MLGQDIETETVHLERNNIYLLDDFESGNEEIDKYIKNKCLNDYSMVTYLVLNTDNNDVICVYSLSCSSMIISSYGKHYPEPAVEIKIFAVNEKYQDLPFSDDKADGCLSNVILGDVMNDIITFTDYICGANLVCLYSTPKAIKFYRKNDFEFYPELAWKDDHRFLDGCTPLFFRLR